ncbi:MAG: hypothetical protein AAGE80_07720 [Pseudomonadota bacterium]
MLKKALTKQIYRLLPAVLAPFGLTSLQAVHLKKLGHGGLG